MVRRVTAKLGNMRKAADFIVYPGTTSTLTIQSDHRIAKFDATTGHGVVSAHRANGAFFADLMFGTPFVASPDLIAAAKAAQPVSGDEIGPGVRIA